MRVMPKRLQNARQAAEIVAIQALSFIAGDPERLGLFLAETGIGPDGSLRFHDPREGLAAMRREWITSRGDVEEYEGRTITPQDNGYLSGKHAEYASKAERKDVQWRFAVLDTPSVNAMAFPGGIVVVTPQGKVSRYFFGVDYAPRDIKFALVESSNEKIGTLADRLLLYCYHYDPSKGNYGFVAMKAIRIGGAVTLLALVGFVFVSLRRETHGQ